MNGAVKCETPFTQPKPSVPEVGSFGCANLGMSELADDSGHRPPPRREASRRIGNHRSGLREQGLTPYGTVHAAQASRLPLVATIFPSLRTPPKML